MIDTAGTICNAAQALIDKGALEVYGCATHAVFSDPAVERLKKSAFTEIVVTDTIQLPEDKKFDKLKIEIRITGFEEDVNNFWDIFKKKKNKNNKLIGANLDDLDIDEKDGCEIKAYYKDKQGHRANVNMRDLTKVSPTIFLPDEMKEENNHFNFEKIKEYTDGMLKQIKDEINYNR